MSLTSYRAAPPRVTTFTAKPARVVRLGGPPPLLQRVHEPSCMRFRVPLVHLSQCTKAVVARPQALRRAPGAACPAWRTPRPQTRTFPDRSRPPDRIGGTNSADQ